METDKKKTDAELARRREVLKALRRIIQAVDLQSRQLLREHGITGPQLVILQEVAAFGPLTVSQLAKATSLSQGTVTNILMRLEKGELVTRTRGELDKRRVYIDVADKCRDLLASAPSPLHETFVERFGGLEEWEQEMILSALKRLSAIMETAPENVAARKRSGRKSRERGAGLTADGPESANVFLSPIDRSPDPSE
jgi:DNA-binding MarR family transcriptional regulator